MYTQVFGKSCAVLHIQLLDIKCNVYIQFRYLIELDSLYESVMEIISEQWLNSFIDTFFCRGGCVFASQTGCAV